MSLKETKKVDTNRYQLEITVDGEKFREAISEAYKKNGKKINVPGFRKGKAPLHLIEKYYGSEIFFEDALNLLYNDLVEDAITESGLKVINDKMDFDLVSISKEDGVDFKVSVTTYPEIEIGEYKGLKAEKTAVKVDAAEVNAEVNAMAERNARMVSVEDRAAKDGDTVIIDFEGFTDGKPFEGGKAEGHSLVLGSGQFIPGFEEQLVGMEIGEDRDINLSFPEQYHAPELAGKAVVFKVKLHEIYNEKEAELNDEFAASLNFPEVQSVEDLKKYINEYLEYQVEARKADAAREKLYDQILESSSCLVSPQAVETAVNMQLQQMAASFAQQGVAMEQYLQMTGKTMDSLKDELKPVAQKQVKLEAVLDEIIRVENITVSDEEMDEQYELISQKYGQPVDVVKQVLPKAQLKPDLLRMKASQLIIDAAEIIMEESGK